MFYEFRKGVFMKRNVLNVCLGLLCAFLFFSCLDDDDDIYVSYGVIQNVNSARDYEILTDKGNTLVVTKSYTNETIEEGKRVLAYYEILSDKDESKQQYEVSISYFYRLISKPVVRESYILQDEEARRDSIGDDPYTQIYAWVGGDYLNIDFETLHAASLTKKHLINLVYDDTRTNADTVYLELFHNAYDELPGQGMSMVSQIGRSSFQIADLIPAGVSSMPIKLTWKEYERFDNYSSKERAAVFEFKRDGVSSDREKGLWNKNNDSSIAIK